MRSPDEAADIISNNKIMISKTLILQYFSSSGTEHEKQSVGIRDNIGLCHAEEHGIPVLSSFLPSHP